MIRRNLFIAFLAALCLVGCSNKSNKINENDEIIVEDQETIIEEDIFQEDTGNHLPVKKDHVYSVSDSLNIDKEVPDSIYHAEFKKKDLYAKNDEKYLRVALFNYDTYGIEDIENLKENNTIIICKDNVVVDKIERDGNFVNINGGLESEKGYCLVLDGDKYRTVLYNDYPLYYLESEAELKLSKDVILEDHSISDGKKDAFEEYNYNNIEKAFDDLIGFSSLDTEVYVENSEIVKIVRNWRP